jgi:O-antigen ligase
VEAQTTNWHKPAFLLASALLLVAPLFRAGNRPLPLLLIELLALGLLLVLLWSPRRLAGVPVPLKVLGAAMLVLPLLYLIPLPEFLWSLAPGRDLYAELLGGAVGASALAWRPLTLIPAVTEGALYATLPVVAVFLAVYLLPHEQVTRLVYLLIGMAVFQALLGLLQYGVPATSPLHLGNPYAAAKTASGTYANRDHLAGLLEMVFPVVLALLAAKVGHSVGRSRRRSRWRRRLDFVASLRGHQALIFGTLAVLLLLGLVFTRSRAGVGLAMVGMFLAMLAFARRLGGNNAYGTLGTVVTVAAVLAAEIGLAPVLDRFAQDPLQDARWEIFASSLEGIGHFFPIGSGADTFPYVYPAFQPATLGNLFINHAHNDYLEGLFDHGVLALLLMLLALVVYLARWPRLWIKGRWGGFRFVQVGAGIGLLLMLLHSLVDFNLQIPANAIVFGFLAAVFLKPYAEDNGERRRRSTSRMPATPPPAAPQPAAPRPEPPAADDGWAEADNPFLR